MKEQLEPQTDPILEECYRIKAEFSAQFNSIEELYNYLKAREKEGEAQGRVYIDPLHLPPSRASSLLCLRCHVFYRIIGALKAQLCAEFVRRQELPEMLFWKLIN